VAARVWVRVRSSEICGGQNRTGAGFLPCQAFHWLLHTHQYSSSRPVVASATVDSVTLHPKKQKKVFKMHTYTVQMLIAWFLLGCLTPLTRRWKQYLPPKRQHAPQNYFLSHFIRYEGKRFPPFTTHYAMKTYGRVPLTSELVGGKWSLSLLRNKPLICRSNRTFFPFSKILINSFNSQMKHNKTLLPHSQLNLMCIYCTRTLTACFGFNEERGIVCYIAQ
jgi:hypothetical protein